LKKIGLLALVLVLLSTAVVLGFVRPAVAEGTIYIRANGSVDPPTAPISTLNNVTYTLTDNITSTGIYDSIIVERNNIVIDGDGYMLQGTLSRAAIKLSWRTNVTVRNTQIRDFYYGISLDYSSNNSISGNTITNNYVGIWLNHSSSNSISGNNIAENRYFGIQLHRSSNNNISGNNITKTNYVGIRLGDSSNNIIYHNNFVNNTFQAYTENSRNVWDDGYPSGGNYWSDYNGIDLYSGLSQNLTHGDGVGDTPYVIDPNNQDKYPFVPPEKLYYKYNELLAKYDDLNATYYGLLAYYDNLKIELNNIRNLMYIFIITTIIFTATTVYFARRKPKIMSTTSVHGKDRSL